MKRSIFSYLVFSLLSLTAFAEDKVSLQDFLNRVLAENLDLKIEAAKADAASAKSIGIAMPPPMVGVSQLKEDTGQSAMGYEINQTIPFPTKLSGDSSARKYEAKAQNENRVAKANEILAQGKFLYFSLWAAQEKLALLLEKKSILENHIKLSRSTARSDNFAGIHLIKAESDLDLLENDILTAEQNLRTKQADAAVYININPANFKSIASEPPLSEVPKIDSVQSTPQLKAMEFTLESFRSKELEAKSSWLPDFNFRYKEMGPTSMASRYNEVMVGVTLPFIFFWEPSSAGKQASSQRAQAEFELEKQKRIIESDRVSLSIKAESLRKQIDNLRVKIIPRAEKRMKLVHNLAPRDIEALQDHREATEAFPELKMKALELRLEFEATVAAMEKYLPNKGSSHETNN